MNRRTLLRSFLGAAVASCVRWLPMPAVAEPEESPALTITMAMLDEALDVVQPPTHFVVWR